MSGDKPKRIYKRCKCGLATATPRSPYCRSCRRLAITAWRQANPDRAAAISQRSCGKHADRRRAERREWAKANPEKRSAQGRAQYAVWKGWLVKPYRCEACGANGRVEAHHADYSKALEVNWLCRTCHRRLHAISRRRIA